MKNILKWGFSLVFIVLLIVFPEVSASSSVGALDLCVKVLFPSLFPFFVLSDIFIKSGGGNFFGYIFNPVMKPLFRINGNGATAFILGIISGYPIGAKTAVNLYKEKAVSKSEAESLICFCNNSGPLFIIGALGTGMLFSKETGLFLYAVHILSAFTVGILLRFTVPKSAISSTAIKKTVYKNNIFISAVENSMMSVIKIFAYVIFFAVIMDICESTNAFFYLQKCLSFLAISPKVSDPLLRSVLEMTSGLKKLSVSKNTLSVKLILSSFVLGWSGISILFQTKSVIDDAGLNFSKYVFFKFVHGIIAGIYTFIAINFLNFNYSAIFLKPLDIARNIPFFQINYIFTYILGVAYITSQVRLRYKFRGLKQKQTKAI